jgi:hypothetical protein
MQSSWSVMLITTHSNITTHPKWSLVRKFSKSKSEELHEYVQKYPHHASLMFAMNHQHTQHTKKILHSNRLKIQQGNGKNFFLEFFLSFFNFSLIKSKFFNDMTWFLWEFELNTKEFLFLVKNKIWI